MVYRPSLRIAFTRVELLNIIGIIGLLTAMLFPAVQMVRESSRRNTCANNVRQLSIAVLNFESSHRHLPVRRFIQSSGNSYYGMTWIAQLLPFLDQSAMWETAIQDYRHNPRPFGNHIGLQTVLPVVGCRSDPVTGETHFTRNRYLIACADSLGIVPKQVPDVFV